ncbi:MAG TPA: trehalose-phosphatase [Actinomycetota bacterium]|nr:trehalose-phosphatase [Actinomycetota bacterium]
MAIPVDGLDAVIFDMDGVVTDTATVHAAAWKRLFDEYLEERGNREGKPWEPFDADTDYRRYVDGRPRYDGVRSFLQSRGITLPEGDPSDSADRETVCGLGNRKDEYFLEQVNRGGVRAFPTTVALVRELDELGIRTAVVSASRNMERVLTAAGVIDLFEVRVSGADADQLQLPGKPHPAIFLEAARRLKLEPTRAAVVEDALAGVEAGRRGGFGLVIGVDRAGYGSALVDAGADVVVSDLGEVRPEATARSENPAPRIRDLRSVLERRDEIAALLNGRRPALFLDYDGTLTPIVDDPARALLPEEARHALRRLAATCPVAVISGRDLDDVRALVGLPNLWYAGSHGFDIAGPGGERHQRNPELVPVLDAAEIELRAAVTSIDGAWVERKRFAVAVHYRQVEAARIGDVEEAVKGVAQAHPELRMTGGKKVFELRPAVPWDKGKALEFLLEVLGLTTEDVLPVYIGDDATDEDAFRVARHRGLAIVVRGEDDSRATAAQYALSDPDQVRMFLEEVVSIEAQR